MRNPIRSPFKNKLTNKRNKSKAADEPNLTPDALAALRRAGFSRRSFLKTTGALIVTFSVAGTSE
jgi:hypothetical protein